MRTNRLPHSGFRRVRSMNELKLEKAKLRMEVIMAEERIKGNYREIREAFSLRNIVNTIITELTNTSSVVSNVITTTRSLFRKKKKKKQTGNADRDQTPEDGGQRSEDAGMNEEA